MGENMGMLSRVIGWVDYFLMWAWAIWFGAGTAVGVVLLVFEEWRLHRSKPKPDEVHAFAARLVVRFGHEALRLNDEAMLTARRAKDFDRYRFLKEVSGVLLDEPFGRHLGPRSPALIEDVSEPMCFPGASPSPSDRQPPRRLVR